MDCIETADCPNAKSCRIGPSGRITFASAERCDSARLTRTGEAGSLDFPPAGVCVQPVVARRYHPVHDRDRKHERHEPANTVPAC